jgi:hypothetical protein
MRTLSSANTALLASGMVAEHLRVSVKDEAGALAQHVQDGSTVALWRFNEAAATDNATDAVGTYPLTKYGNPGVVVGLLGGARSLNGSTQFFQRAGSAGLGTVLNGEWTFEGWVNLTSLAGGLLFMYSGLDFSGVEDDTILAEVGIATGGKVYWHAWQNTSTFQEGLSATTLVAGDWYHVAVSKVAQGANLYTYNVYVDGVLETTAVDVPGLDYVVTGATHNIGVGCYVDYAGLGNAAGVINAKLDDFRLSNVARSEAEILTDGTAGAWRNLTTYPGVNLVESAAWREDIDSPHRTADIVLKREVEKLSLSPLMPDSALNRAFLPTSAAAALLALNREIKIEVAIVPMDKTPDSSDWMTVFHGYIDSIDPASGANVTVGARDLAGAVADRFIETERVYSYGVVGSTAVSMRIWEPGMTLALYEYVLPATRGAADSGYCRFYQVTAITTGLTGSTEPSWPSSGTPVVDGGVTFTLQSNPTTTAGNPLEQVMQNLLEDNDILTGALDVPVSPGWAIRQYLQKREPLLGALKSLAAQIGWDVRSVWKASANAFALRLFEPERSKSVADYTFSAADYADIRRLAIDKSGIRNVVRVIYSDMGDLSPDGTPKRKTLEASDATSITNYGRLFMEIAEDQNSQIDSSTEAQSMADAALADLKSPVADAEVEMVRGFPWVELGDLYSFTPNARHFSTTQSLAVYSYEHRAEAGCIRTTMRLRGQPAGMYIGWHRRAAHPKVNPNHALTQFQAPAGLAVSAAPTVGGARITLGLAPDKAAHVEDFEHHLSTLASFTPDASTLVAVSKARTLEVSELDPGTTYYHRVVERTFNAERIIRGQPSEEMPFVAGNAKSQHIDTSVSPGLFPANFAFEHALRALSTWPPDHWEVVAGSTWGSSGDVYHTTDAQGTRAVVLRETANVCSLKSDLFPLVPLSAYNINVFYRSRKVSANGTNLNIFVDFYKDTAGTAASTATATHLLTVSIDDTWLVVPFYRKSVPLDANFARIRLAKTAADANRMFDVSFVSFTRCDVLQEDVTSASLQNSWVNAGGGDALAEFYLDSFERVHTRGVIKNGTQTAGTLLFTYPAGYAPSTNHYFVAENNGATAYLKLNGSNGQVTIISVANNTRLCLDSLNFRKFR